MIFISTRRLSDDHETYIFKFVFQQTLTNKTQGPLDPDTRNIKRFKGSINSKLSPELST